MWIDEGKLGLVAVSTSAGSHPALHRDIATLQAQGAIILGLWSKHTVEPHATIIGDGQLGGGGEVAFRVSDDETVNTIHDEWIRRGLAIVQEPTKMDFGYTFVAKDPDGHRLRVFAAGAKILKDSALLFQSFGFLPEGLHLVQRSGFWLFM